MKILKYDNNKLSPIGVNQFIDMLIKYNEISIVGSGGKTTLLYNLLNSFSLREKVVGLTTTNMYLPKVNFIEENNSSLYYNGELITYDNLLNLISTNSHYLIGSINEKGKMSPVSNKLFEFLKKSNIKLLLECDGSKRKPIKSPRLGEPVINPSSDLIIILCGLSGLRKKIKDNVCREELVRQLLEKPNDFDIINEKDISKLINESYILPLMKKFKNSKIITILNQCDTTLLENSALLISKNLLSDVYVTSFSIDKRQDIDVYPYTIIY